ncbi:LysR family transcriptional regulator [Paenibacillus thalictri]|uniref:LysR family transcriptional regulator n=1 Tax=Paenibacillus thalictri TaxID=2527873 RepID=A0A4Q9DW03_9BACL|nr:LysR family transcriptional regulator [Paenibacillus thalictri]TBL81209.1 LysR family transcriptional regulator [Paenibacillus thalictri]
MNLHALRLFYEVAKCGSVTKAAESAHISQPAVSAQLRNLEKELGIALLAPKGRGILLTEGGELLYAQARRLFGLERDMEAQLALYSAGRYGSLRIAATYLPANYLLPRWLAGFRSRFPDVALEVATMNSQMACEQLSRFEADLAIVGGASALARSAAAVERVEVLSDEVWFVVPPEHRMAGRQVALAELLAEPFIVREDGSSMQQLLLAVCRMHRLPAPAAALKLGGSSETIRAVTAGLGAGLLSALEVRGEVERGSLARVYVDAELPANPIAVCTRSDEPHKPALAQLLTHIREQVEQL